MKPQLRRWFPLLEIHRSTAVHEDPSCQPSSCSSSSARFVTQGWDRSRPTSPGASRRRAASREFFCTPGGPLERRLLYADRAGRRRGSPPILAASLCLRPRANVVRVLWRASIWRHSEQLLCG
jgi:hypothetical protein